MTEFDPAKSYNVRAEVPLADGTVRSLVNDVRIPGELMIDWYREDTTNGNVYLSDLAEAGAKGAFGRVLADGDEIDESGEILISFVEA